MAQEVVSSIVIVSGIGEQGVEAQESRIDVAGVGEGFDKRNAVELVRVHEAEIYGKIEPERGVVG